LTEVGGTRVNDIKPEEEIQHCLIEKNLGTSVLALIEIEGTRIKDVNT
jgi:hypothetical protein